MLGLVTKVRTWTHANWDFTGAQEQLWLDVLPMPLITHNSDRYGIVEFNVPLDTV